jgi:hypothetical protein
MNGSQLPPPTSFPPTSRYAGVPTATIKGPTGEPVVYLRRRFVPQPERFVLLTEHVVTKGERLDNITATYLDDPLQFWRICDANRAVRPDDLTADVGRRLRITLPEGIPGGGGLPGA